MGRRKFSDLKIFALLALVGQFPAQVLMTFGTRQSTDAGYPFEGKCLGQKTGGKPHGCAGGPEDIHEVRELREILEVGALRLSFAKMNATKLSRLQKICDDFTAMYKQGYFSGAMEADMKFHETLFEFAGNDGLYQAYHTSPIVFFHLKLGKTHTYLDDFPQTDAEHRKIVQYIKEKKGKQAEEALIRHLTRGAASVLGLN